MRWLFLTLMLLLFPSDGYACPNVCPAPFGVLHLVGDSQCVGSSWITSRVPDAKRWTSVAATCKGGTRVPYWGEHLDEANLKPGDAVVVFLGSNDWSKPDPKPILRKIAAAKARCVWVGPPLIRGKDNGVADHLKKEIEADGTCRYLDSRQLHLIQPDGVHTSESVRWLTAAISLLLS